MIVYICSICRQTFTAEQRSTIDATIVDHALLCDIRRAAREAAEQAKQTA